MSTEQRVAAKALRYRPDIDGLRAVAVLLVLAFHAFPSHLAGGFQGVDIFFVISGFLISRIIFDGFRAGTFSFKDFYSRRARRIFPCLIIVLAACLVFGWFALFPDEYQNLGLNVSGGTFFISNILFANQFGYFDTSAETKPLLHLWSLGIEEQFYLIWPFVIWFAVKTKRNLAVVTFAICLLSFMMNLYFVRAYPTASFYFPHSRIWELLIGNLLACAVDQERSFRLGQVFDAVSKFFTTNVRSAVGALAIFVGLLGSKSHAFPGWWAIWVVVGTAFVLSSPTAWFNRRILSNRVLVAIGLISFPLYLWHWPLLSFARIIQGGTEVSATIRIGLLATSFFLAYLSYVLIEHPLRRSRGGTVVIALSVILAVIGLCGLALNFEGGWPTRTAMLRMDPALKKIRFSMTDWDFPPRSFEKTETKNLVYYERPGATGRFTLFLGDSNVEQYAPRIEKVVLNPEFRANGAILIGSQKPCEHLKAAMLKTGCDAQLGEVVALARRADVSTIVIAASWLKYDHLFNSSAEIENFVTFLQNISDRKKLFLVKNIPRDEMLNPQSYFLGRRPFSVGVPRPISVTLSKKDAYRLFTDVNRALDQIATRAGAELIDPARRLCPNEICATYSGDGYPLYLNDGHLTATYARVAADFLDKTLISVDRAGD